MWERNSDRLPLAHNLIRDWTCNLGMCLVWVWGCNLLVYGMMLQPPEPCWPGLSYWAFCLLKMWFVSEGTIWKVGFVKHVFTHFTVLPLVNLLILWQDLCVPVQKGSRFILNLNVYSWSWMEQLWTLFSIMWDWTETRVINNWNHTEIIYNIPFLK